MTEGIFVLEPGRLSLATLRRIERDGAAIALAPECRVAGRAPRAPPPYMADPSGPVEGHPGAPDPHRMRPRQNERVAIESCEAANPAMIPIGPCEEETEP